MVVAGIIQENARILIGQRKLGGRHPLKWEFPGGKVEQGETPQEALKRELSEELAIDAVIGRELVRYEFSYNRRRPTLLIFYRITSYEGNPVNRVFEQIRWEDLSKLPRYDFLEGDFDFIRRFTRGEFR